MKFKVLVTDYVWPSIKPERAVLNKAGAELIIAPDSKEDTLVKLALDVDAILTCFALVTERVVRAAEKCVVIGRYGVGVDNIAINTATELGIAVTYVPDYCIEEVSDHVLAFLLAWNRRIVLFDRSVKTTGWRGTDLDMRIMRLRGKKMGIIGFGRIGRSVAEKARVFGLELLAYDPYLTPDEVAQNGAKKVSMTTLLRESDFVTLHSPLTSETRNLIGETELKMMKPHAFLINAARGQLIDETALYQALDNGQIAGAGLDVLVDTNPSHEHPLIEHDNVIVSPHTAFFSQESVLELEERAAGEVARVLLGQMPHNLVNKAVLSHPNPRHTLPNA